MYSLSQQETSLMHYELYVYLFLCNSVNEIICELNCRATFFKISNQNLPQKLLIVPASKHIELKENTYLFWFPQQATKQFLLLSFVLFLYMFLQWKYPLRTIIDFLSKFVTVMVWWHDRTAAIHYLNVFVKVAYLRSAKLHVHELTSYDSLICNCLPHLNLKSWTWTKRPVKLFNFLESLVYVFMLHCLRFL